MSYVSNTDADRREMLAVIGVESVTDLLTPLPESIRLNDHLALPQGLDEMSVVRQLQHLAGRNIDLESALSFLGAGVYDHFRPSVIHALISRGEFATAYTPYQPELSQGMLQAVYEFQTLICALTGMDLANASMYDGATSLAESALMACDLTSRSQVVVSASVHPNYRAVLATYLHATGNELVVVPYAGDSSDQSALEASVSERTACVLLQQPTFFGTVEELSAVVETAHRHDALAILSVDPIALGLLKPPGELDVDVVVGEGQSLGNPMGFGGPLLGLFACKKKFIRHFPGRIVGATVDQQGRRGYTMTLRTREQDIRREKATSNICTNEALLALAATVYLCELGQSGLRQVADLCLQKAHYACKTLCVMPGIAMLYPERPFFKEFALRLPVDPQQLNKDLLAHGIVGGLPLGSVDGTLGDAMLFCVTETKTRQDIDRLVAAIANSIEKVR